MAKPQSLKAADREKLLETLQGRFESNPGRHAGISWSEVAERLTAASANLAALSDMEATGGEPDVIGRDRKSGELLFCDCSKESPKGRRSVCYDAEALAKRKENKPRDSAVAMAGAVGIQILDEAQYRDLQNLGEFDTTTSSWVRTPPEIRERGGALFCDFRYGQVFLYHNGADSYYAARGFRGLLRI